MTDIVERLRARPWQKDVLVCEDVCLEAAAEIVRLRKEIDEAIGMCLGNVGIGQIHAKLARAALEPKP